MAKRLTRVVLLAAVLLIASPSLCRANETHASVRRLEASDSKPVCSAIPRQGEVAKGIDLITDLSCKDGKVGCLGVNCRYCQRIKTPESEILETCESIEDRAKEREKHNQKSVDKKPEAEAHQANTKSDAAPVATKDSTGASKIFHVALLLALCVAGSVAAAVFATKMVKRRRHSREMMTPPTSLALAYHRSSVFEI